jgi:hypothetical protein
MDDLKVDLMGARMAVLSAAQRAVWMADLLAAHLVDWKVDEKVESLVAH